MKFQNKEKYDTKMFEYVKKNIFPAENKIKKSVNT